MDTLDRPVPWLLFGAELIGTALLVAVGLSFVILGFGPSSPVVQLIPSAGWRRLITGFLFGTTGALIALSPLGKESGANINPVVHGWPRARKGRGVPGSRRRSTNTARKLSE